jgi:hypothetical protein
VKGDGVHVADDGKILVEETGARVAKCDLVVRGNAIVALAVLTLFAGWASPQRRRCRV